MKCASALLLAATVAGCGGGSPLDNAATIENPPGTGGRKLSFEYFQRCIQPVLLAPLATGNTCASSGCHDNVAGTGGALRVVPAAAVVDTAALTPDAIHATDMFKNFYSAQGVTVIGSPSQSRLLAKPLVLNTLHGGGQVFASATEENARRIAYWISRPMPEGQDEFSSAGNSLFTPNDPRTGACNTQ
jgi:hypothetical protein